jgi:two-component system response regulator NreC
VLDLGMPGLSAFEAIRSITKHCPDVHVLVLSMHKGRQTVIRTLEAGAKGFIPKSTVHTELLKAIRVVRQGKRYLHPAAMDAIVHEVRDWSSESVLLEPLSVREVQVLQLTARGFISREIGERLSISPKTVDTYRQRVMQKLDLNHRSEFVEVAFKSGLLEDAFSQI